MISLVFPLDLLKNIDERRQALGKKRSEYLRDLCVRDLSEQDEPVDLSGLEQIGTLLKDQLLVQVQGLKQDFDYQIGDLKRYLGVLMEAFLSMQDRMLEAKDE